MFLVLGDVFGAAVPTGPHTFFELCLVNSSARKLRKKNALIIRAFSCNVLCQAISSILEDHNVEGFEWI